MNNVLRFKQSQIPRQTGEQARLKVVQGPDYGTTYVITGLKASIGRGEENDIMISDLKSSRMHAEFVLASDGKGGRIWRVRDMGSANGILYNGKAARDAKLKNGDTVTIGETTLEFMTMEAGTMMLVAPPRSAQQVQIDNALLMARKDSLQKPGVFGGGAEGDAAANRKKVLLTAALAAAAFMLFSNDDPKPKPRPKVNDDAARDLSSFLPSADTSTMKAAESFFRLGFREFEHGNYMRAKTQFETVLQMAPAHVKAEHFLSECNQRIEAQVKGHLQLGKADYDSGKLKTAKGHFEEVMRLLYRDQTNPSFVEAKEQLAKVAKDIEGGG